MGRTMTGLEVLAEDPAIVKGARVGLLTNYTGVSANFERNIDILRERGVDLVALFGPEHGINGSAQAGFSESVAKDEATGLPIVDTYAAHDRLALVFAEYDLDVLVCDIQDIGVRYWTYVWSLYDAMLAAAEARIRVVVLDRPNPLGGRQVEGLDLDRSFASFVGRTSIRQRHGLTIGELARLFNARDIPAATCAGLQLDVVPMRGWSRDTMWERTGLPWVMPSPNTPTPDTAYAFAATGLLEGTNVSEGRGTTRPFELFGAPFVDRRFVPTLRGYGLPGVAFRETWFRPTFHKYAETTVRGAQLYVTDRAAYRPVRTGLAVLNTLADLYSDDFIVVADDDAARTEESPFALDRLWGSDSLRHALTGGGDAMTLVDGVATRPEDVYPESVLLY